MFALSLMPGLASADSAVTRIKDISKIQGVRSNQLIGYGLVVGLNGTGDSTAHQYTAVGREHAQEFWRFSGAGIAEA